MSATAHEIAREFWPGPLTLVLPIKEKADLAPWATQGGFLALRVSSNKVANQLTDGLARPIISTSANRSGRSPCYDTSCVRKQFSSSEYQPDMILDAGKLQKQEASTIVRVVGSDVEVLRQGSIILSKYFV